MPARGREGLRSAWSACLFATLAVSILAAIPGPAHAATVTVDVVAPTGNETWSGGSTHGVRWTMDTDSGNPSLTVDLEYLVAGVPVMIDSGLASPVQTENLYSWTLPAQDQTNVTVRVCASDIAGGSACDESPPFRVDGVVPTVVSFAPVGSNVGPLDPITVEFSEPMNLTRLSGSFSLSPDPGGLTVRPYRDGILVDHSAFAPGLTYQATISCAATDPSDPGHPTSGCPIVWTFRTATPPTLAWVAPAGGERWTGGSDHELRWMAADAEDARASLDVTAEFSPDGAIWSPIAGPLAGDSSYVWTAPFVDAPTAFVRARVRDTRGLETTTPSAPFAIDASPPSVLATSPRDREGDVSWLAPVLITFSEPMDTSSGPEAFSVRSASGPYIPGTVSWDSSTVARITPAMGYRASTPHVVRVNVTANDASDPGNPMAAPFEFTFFPRANAGPFVSFSSAPIGVVSGETSWSIAWMAQDEDDTPADLRVYLEFSDGGAFLPLAGPLAPWDTFLFTVPAQSTSSAALRVRVVDSQGTEGTDVAVFAIDADPPIVVDVSPAPGANDVLPDSPIVIRFSEPVNATGAVGLRLVGGPWIATASAWDDPATLRLTPLTRLSERTEYEVMLNDTARDLSLPGNRLAPASWRFRVASLPPSVVLSAPTTVWSAGSIHSVAFATFDEDPFLDVTIDISVDGAAFAPILTATMPTGTATFSMTAPRVDAPDAVLRACARDDAGASACATVAIPIDGVAPSLVSMSPAPGSRFVPPEGPLVLTFSESMAASAADALRLAPTSPLSFRWARTRVDSDTLIVDHGRLLELRAYTVDLACSARDASDPGLPLADPCPLGWTFTTAATPEVRLLAPVGGERLTGGAEHTIRWVSSDEEAVLAVSLGLSLDGGATFAPLLERGTFPTGDVRWPRILPAADVPDARVRVTVQDSNGLAASATSQPFMLDATPPRIVASTPADGDSEVSPIGDLVLTFSESLDPSSFLDAFATAPGLRDVVLAWSATQAPFDTVHVRHAPIRLGTGVTLTLDGVRDASRPGNAAREALAFSIRPDREEPRVSLSVDAEAEKGQVLVLDATASSDNDEIVGYEWWIADDEGRTVARLRGPRVEYRTSDPGTLHVTVQVVDASGNAARGNADVLVHTLDTTIVALPLSQDAILGWVAIVGGATGTAWGLTDRGRSFLSRAVWLPLYIRMRPGEVRDNEKRGMIRGYVMVNPGDTYTDIKRNLCFQNGELAYHLQVLERAGIVQSVTKGGRRMYYPAGMEIPPEDASGLHEVQGLLLRHVEEVPGMYVRDLAVLLHISTQLAMYHARKLAEKGHVRFERERLKFRVYPVPRDA